MNFHEDILKIDCKNEVERICSFIKQQTIMMKRDGIVIGISGGIDSALSVKLCVKTLEKDQVFGLILPEKESDPISSIYAKKFAEKLGIKIGTIDITSTLEGFGTYNKRDKVIKKIFPEYDSNYKFKITLPLDLLSRDAYNFFTLTIIDKKGNMKSSRLNNEALKSIVAATDTKQRTRMMHLYYYAEMKNYLVCGTTNRSEFIQGLFVKFGDGGVDIEPLAHLYKSQIYQLSEYLGIDKDIIDRTPSPDTFSFHVSDEEFYFRIPYNKLDLLLYAWEKNINVSEICKVMDLNEDKVKRAFRDFKSKYNATKHLRQLPTILPMELGEMRR